MFGSNTQGRHGKGAAKYALDYHGAIYGQSEGMQGSSYGIITKNISGKGNKVSLEDIGVSVYKFMDFAKNNQNLKFNVTKIGCGLAGFTEVDIMKLFKGAPNNVILPDGWNPNA
ncbi:MAG: hypothetical protein OEY89_16675 [Gammaproteobacteria bacterium]|nr:hypothetical protein [Gammaproteobacteria bacterium]